MEKPVTTVRARLHRAASRRGAVLALMPAVLLMVIAIAAMMIDLGFITSVKSRVQSAADSASLAGALRLRQEYEGPQTSDIYKVAIQFAELNQPGIQGVLQNADIEVGEWDNTSRAFYPGADHTNAVRVTVRRKSGHSESIPTFFSHIFGIRESEVNVTSVSAFEVYEDDEGNDELTMPFIVD